MVAAHLRKSSLCLTLLVASLAYSAVAQGSPPLDAQVRDHLRRAQTALQANDSASAKKEFRAALALDPKNPAAHAGIGVLEMGRGDCRAASDELHSALAAQPSFTKALALLGICQKRMGEPSARASLEKAFQKLEEKSLRVQLGMELCGLYEQQGDMEAAASLMRKLVKFDPENADILFVAQRIYSDLAEDTLNKLAVVGPGSARMQQAIAEKLNSKPASPLTAMQLRRNACWQKSRCCSQHRTGHSHTISGHTNSTRMKFKRRWVLQTSRCMKIRRRLSNTCAWPCDRIR